MSADPRATMEEAGLLVRGVQSRMWSDGMRDDPNYRDLDIRIATALASVEVAYHEAHWHAKRLSGGGGAL